MPEDTNRVEHWWVLHNNGPTLADIYVLNGVQIECFVTGHEGPLDIQDVAPIEQIRMSDAAKKRRSNRRGAHRDA